MTGPIGKAVLTVMSAFGQLERDQLAERTMAGMAADAANVGQEGATTAQGGATSSVPVR